ncbi:sugar phosphate isomerase/epimerase family protein [Tundrisphaera sp. TA3]|uniref:sugar phosphate isomerase/epimerase family protein n=1 Tax=Tundrisphaera sp. TA3 TaxID=3435775 RepID=UPI003EBB042A
MYRSFSAKAVGLAHLPAEAAIDLAHEGGFQGVDLLVGDLVKAGSDPRAIRDRIAERGLIPGAWHLPVDWRGDEPAFLRDLAELPRYAAAAAEIGLLRTGTAVLVETPQRPETEEGRAAHLAEVAAMHVRRLGQIARILDDHGIRIGLEVVGVRSFPTGRGIPFITRLADLDPTLEGIWDEASNLGILLDAFHLYAADEPVEAGLARGIGRVAWVHVADLPADVGPDRDRIIDGDRGLPGENGAVDVAGFLRRLKDEGYDGPVTVEPMPRCRSLAGLQPIEVARKVGQALNAAWPT